MVVIRLGINVVPQVFSPQSRGAHPVSFRRAHPVPAKKGIDPDTGGAIISLMIQEEKTITNHER